VKSRLLSIPTYWRAVGLASFALTTLTAQSTRAAPLAETPTARGQFDAPFKTLKLRKLARKVFGVGAESRDNDPIWLGPLRFSLLWRLAWRWNDSTLDSTRTHGLRGGPVISLDLPLERWLSLETRLCSFRYVYARSQPPRLVSDELADPSHERRSLEAGLFMNIHLDGLL
jgi:hypothetical protein